MDNAVVEQEIISLQQKGKTKEEITVALLEKGATSDQLIATFEKVKEDKARQILETPNYHTSVDLTTTVKPFPYKYPGFMSTFFSRIFHMLMWSIFFLIILSAFSFGSMYIMAQNYKSLAQKARFSGDIAKAEEYERKSKEALESQVLSEWFAYFGFMKSVMNDIEDFSNNSGVTKVSTSMSTTTKTSFLTVDQKGIFTAIRKRDIMFYTQALELYKKDTGTYPPGITQTERLISATEANLCSYLFPKYIPQMFVDPVSLQTNPSLVVKDCRIYDTGYTVKLTAQNTLYINAPHSDNAVNSSTASEK